MKRILLLSVFLLTSVFSNAQLVISEISYNPPESGTDSLEYIELYNETDATIDLAGYIIADNNADTISSGSVGGGEYVILAINPAAIQEILGVSSIGIERIATNNGGETITISSPTGDVIDEVTYDDEGDWPSFDDGADGAGATIEVCDLTADNNDGSNWGVSTNDLGVIVNDRAFLGTPNAANSSSCDFVPDYIVEVSNNVFTPSDITINVGESIRWINVQGFHNVNGALDVYPDNPEGFRNGDAASGAWTFDYTFNVEGLYNYQCDPHAGLGMVGTVTVEGEVEPTIPTYDIGIVNTIDADGLPDSTGVNCIIEGTVHGANLRGGGLQFAVIDDSGDAIGLFASTDLGYTYNEGDIIRVTGFIGHFNGLLQISATAVEFLGEGTLRTPIVVTSLGEDTESQLIQVNGLTLVNAEDWAGDGSSFNVEFSDADGNIIAVRIDSDTEVATWEGPLDGEYKVIGIGGQFDNSAPHNEGYQMFPRYISDFDNLSSIEDVLKVKVNIYPNPVVDVINIMTDITPEQYAVYNRTGQLIENGPFQNRLDVSTYASGSYLLVLTKEGKSKTIYFVK